MVRGGGRGIRTPGYFRNNGFQDRHIRPLCQPSMVVPCSSWSGAAQSTQCDMADHQGSNSSRCVRDDPVRGGERSGGAQLLHGVLHEGDEGLLRRRT